MLIFWRKRYLFGDVGFISFVLLYGMPVPVYILVKLKMIIDYGQSLSAVTNVI